jgi:predicted nuclease with TOPRIM domain
MSDADYIKQIEKANSKLTEIAAIDRQQFEMLTEKYDALVEAMENHMEDMLNEAKSIETFLSYSANKKGNVEYSKRSVEQHRSKATGIVRHIEGILDDIDKSKGNRLWKPTYDGI